MRLHDRIIELSIRAVLDALEESGNAPITERLERAVRAFVTTTASDPRWARLSYVEAVGVSDAVEAHRIAWRERWAALLVARPSGPSPGARPARGTSGWARSG
jgi:hypothetical protein